MAEAKQRDQPVTTRGRAAVFLGNQLHSGEQPAHVPPRRPGPPPPPPPPPTPASTTRTAPPFPIYASRASPAVIHHSIHSPFSEHDVNHRTPPFDLAQSKSEDEPPGERRNQRARRRRGAGDGRVGGDAEAPRAAAERAHPLLALAEVRGRAPVARPRDRPRGARRVQRGRGDHQGKQGEVRAGQEDGAHQGGPGPLLLRSVPAQLRIHPPHALRGQRPHGRPRPHAGTYPTGRLPPGQGHRPHAHDRPGGEGRQDHRRLRRRPRVPPLQRPQRALSSPPSGDQALLRRLQEEREQGGGRQRVLARR